MVADVMESEAGVISDDSETTLLLPKEKIRQNKEASKCRKAVVMVACIMQFVFTCGIGYGLGVMYAELIIVFDVFRTEASLIQSLNMGLSCSAGIFFTGAIQKLGPGLSIAVGGVIAAAGLFASAFATGLTLVIICTGVVTGVGLSILYLCGYIVIGRLFRTNSSFFLIILTTGISIGQFLYPLLFDMFITEYTWSGAFILIAGITLNAVPTGLIIHFSEGYLDEQKSSQPKHSSCDRTLLTDSVFWIIMINGFLFTGTICMEAWFIVDHVVSSRGFSRDQGSLLVSVIGTGSLVGRFLGGALRYYFKCSTGYHWVYLFMVIAGLHVLVINLYGFWPLVAACFIYGVVFASSTSQLAAITLEASGLERYLQAMGLVNLVAGFGDFIGPVFGGAMKDTFGAYDIAFYTASGASLYCSLSTVIMLFIQRRRERLIKTDEYEIILKS